MEKYHVAIAGNTGLITMTRKELQELVKEETTKCRRYFGTAVAHLRMHEDGARTITITARKDTRSALWTRIVAHKH